MIPNYLTSLFAKLVIDPVLLAECQRLLWPQVVVDNDKDLFRYLIWKKNKDNDTQGLP